MTKEEIRDDLKREALSGTRFALKLLIVRLERDGCSDEAIAVAKALVAVDRAITTHLNPTDSSQPAEVLK